MVRPGADGVAKRHNEYGDDHDKANLAHRDLPGLLDGFTDILRGCATLLRPGGVVIVTARPWRKRGGLVDLPSAVVAAGIPLLLGVTAVGLAAFGVYSLLLARYRRIVF